METGAIGIYFLAHQIRISAVFTHVRYFLSHIPVPASANHVAFQRIQDFLEAFFMIFQYKMWYLSKKKIHYSCEGGLEKSIPCDVMPIGYPRGGFFYPTLILMILIISPRSL